VAQDAGQLVEGNLVKVGGITAGEVEEISLDERNRARVLLRIDEDRFRPLRRGTTATIRATSLSSVAGRIVALHPGPDDARPIPDGGDIPPDATQAIVEIDQIVNTLDARTRSALQQVTRGGADGLGDRGPATRAALEALSPALQETAATAGELVRDQRAFRRALVASSGVMGAVAGERDALERGIARGATALGAVAREREALDETLRRAPGVLRSSNSMLAELRVALEDLRPALRDGLPVAQRLPPVLRDLRPVLREAGPVARDLRPLLREATAVLDRLPRTERSARPALSSARTALGAAEPVVAALRAYTPDAVAGLLNGFGGTTAGYYDANGHYARISLQGNPFSLQGLLSGLDVPQGDGGIAGWRRGVLARCPGSAAPPHPGGGNPWHAPEAPCRPEDDGR
jgi:phospholipid/cholesterol/gamma-HCH transport system substrate-binding protein